MNKIESAQPKRVPMVYYRVNTRVQMFYFEYNTYVPLKGPEPAFGNRMKNTHLVFLFYFHFLSKHVDF